MGELGKLRELGGLGRVDELGEVVEWLGLGGKKGDSGGRREAIEVVK